jgi:hypothetical protein
MVTQKSPMFHAGHQEEGFVLVSALLFLLLLTLIGTFGLNATNMEIQISGNDRIRKEIFFQADGGAQLGLRLLEGNLENLGAYTALNLGFLRESNNTVLIDNPSFVNNEALRLPTDTARDIAYFPAGFDPAALDAPHTNITVHCQDATPSPGSNLQMVGYQNHADKGAQVNCTVSSQHLGRAGSEAVVQVNWIHVAGLESDGRY